MPHSLTDILKQRLGIHMPTAPEVSPEQLALKEELAKREQAKQSGWRTAGQKIMTAPAEMLSGLFDDPTQSLTPEQRNPAYAVGAMGASLPFGPKGIKGMWSKAERLVEGMGKKVPVGELAGAIKGRVNPSEAQWRGLDKFMEGRTGTVNRDELVGHLEQNPLDVRVKERAPRGAELMHPNGPGWNRIDETGWDTYQMPGKIDGTYRETLIQLAPSEKALHPGMTPAEQMEFAPKSGPDLFRDHHYPDDPNVVVSVRHNERNLPPAQSLHDIFDVANAENVGTAPFQGAAAEWRIPVRGESMSWSGFGNTAEEAAQEAFKNRSNLGGSPPKNIGPRGRMIENLQSEWQNQGRKRGFATSSEPVQNSRTVAQQTTDMDRRLDEVTRETQEQFMRYLVPEELAALDPSDVPSYMVNRLHEAGPLDEAAYQAAERLQLARVERDNAYDALMHADEQGPVPDMPFRNTADIAKLGLKQQLLDIAHNRPDLEWLGIAPSSELRARGERISPKFQDMQLPEELERLLKPFGGRVERGVDLGLPARRYAPVGGSGVAEMGGHLEVASVWPRYNALREDSAISRADQLANLLDKAPNNRLTSPGIARLTPDLLKQIREKGFNLAAFLAMMQATQQGEQ